MKYLLILTILIALSASVSAFTVTNDFSSAALNGSIYVQNNVSGNISMSIYGGSLNFVGNSSQGACQRGSYAANLSFKPAYVINSSSNGYIEFRINLISGYTDPNFGFTAGLTNGIWSTGSEGLYLVDNSGAQRFLLINGQTGANPCPAIQYAMDSNSHLFKIVVERVGYDTIYTAYWDTLLWCQFTRTGAKPDLFGVLMDNSCGAAPHIIEYDDLAYSTGENITASGIYATGLTCNTDSDCISGFCNFMKVCALKTFKQACTDNSQCVSGQCAYGLCSQPTLWQNVNQAKNDWVGTDEATNNIMAFIISFALLIAVVVLGVSVAKMEGGAPFYLGGVIFLMSMFFFAAVGWLSGWIIFAIILAMGLIVLFTVLLHRG